MRELFYRASFIFIFENTIWGNPHRMQAGLLSPSSIRAGADLCLCRDCRIVIPIYLTRNC
jgi:hypothetical protein